MGRALLAFALLIGAMLPNAGCTSRPTLGEQCALNTGCQAPLVCRLSRCRRACATDRDCPIASRCVVDAEGLGSCLLPDEDECALDGECPESLVCVDRRCTNECAESRDCPPGSTCTDGACVSNAGRECQLSVECEAPLVCIADRCRPRCQTDRDCREGAECAAGACLPLTEGSDGGTDSDGGVDGGTPTDGGVDAAVDAAPPLCGDMGACESVHQAVVGCDAGGTRCEIQSCNAPFLDCDGLYYNGCEVRPSAHRLHCGGCGNACADGEACFESSCEPATIEQVAMARQDDHRCIRWSNGRVSCWGRNSEGQVGIGTVDHPVAVPVHLPGLDDASDLCTGVNFTCAVRTGGGVVCWGNHGKGQIGNGDPATATAYPAPTAVMGLSDAVDVECNRLSACALRATGEVVCWGEGTRGELGNGARSDEPAPVPASGISDATAITGAYRSTCVLRESGEAWCWGFGNQGQLGDGNRRVMTDYWSEVPVRVRGLGTVTIEAVHQQGFAGFVRDTDGRTYAWGYNARYACGLPTLDRYILTPTEVPELMGAPTIDHTCAIDGEGAQLCWGLNQDGQLGFGTFDSPIDRPTPTGQTDVVGLGYGCVILSGGRLRCAGDNRYSQLGDATTIGSTVYQPVEGLL